MATDYIIDAQQLGKTVATAEQDLSILSGVTLRIKLGESIAIVGVSGSGKSTLLSLLAGLDTPSTGSVRLCGEDLFSLNEDGRARVRAQQVGFVFQSFQLLDSLTALENVLLPLELAGRDTPEVAREWLERVGLASRAGHYPRQLSGGEQQRVAIARAFAAQPKVLFADEPTGNLDTRTGQRIIDLLFELNRDHRTTLVLVTHDEHLAERCDRRVQIEAGALVTGDVVA